MSRRRSASIVFDFFFGSCQSGIRIGLFLSDVELLNQACSLHGLALGHSHSVVKLYSLLLQHFLHGECLASDTRSKHRDYTACCEVAVASSDLANCILDMLMSADTSAISSDNLWTVAQSICSDIDSVCHQEDHHRRTVCLLNIFRSWGAYEAVSKSSHSLFSMAEHMSRTSGMLRIVMMIFLIGEPTDLECRIYKFIF